MHTNTCVWGTSRARADVPEGRLQEARPGDLQGPGEGQEERLRKQPGSAGHGAAQNRERGTHARRVFSLIHSTVKQQQGVCVLCVCACVCVLCVCVVCVCCVCAVWEGLCGCGCEMVGMWVGVGARGVRGERVEVGR